MGSPGKYKRPSTLQAGKSYVLLRELRDGTMQYYDVEFVSYQPSPAVVVVKFRGDRHICVPRERLFEVIDSSDMDQ
jgi:hypothetical protein